MSAEVSLYGDALPENYTGKKVHGHIARKKQQMNYRRATDKARSCKTCDHCIGRNYGAKYYKCELIGMSHSLSTDVRLRDTCNHWEILK